MRIQLNLNKYYKDLGQEDINKIFGSMLDLKPNVNQLEYIYNIKREFTKKERVLRTIAETHFEFKVNKLDLYMEELGKESIFGTKEGDHLTEEQIKQIIEKYKFLMSKVN